MLPKPKLLLQKYLSHTCLPDNDNNDTAKFLQFWTLKLFNANVPKALNCFGPTPTNSQSSATYWVLSSLMSKDVAPLSPSTWNVRVSLPLQTVWQWLTCSGDWSSALLLVSELYKLGSDFVRSIILTVLHPVVVFDIFAYNYTQPTDLQYCHL